MIEYSYVHNKRRGMRYFFLMVLTTVLVCAGCSKNSSSGDDSGTTDTDTDTDSDTDTDTETESTWPEQLIPAECPSSLVEPCGETAYEPPVRLLASQLGDGVRFVDVAFGAILAQRDDGVTNEPVLFAIDFNFLDERTTNVVQGGAAQGLESVAIAGHIDHQANPRYLAILCAEENCALYKSNADEETGDNMVPVPGGELPSDLEPRGLTRHSDLFNSVWVFGNGIWFFDGSQWHEESLPSEDIMVNNLSTYRRFSVGDSGRIMEKQNQLWVDLVSGTSADLIDILDNESTYYPLIAAGDGSVGILDNEIVQYESLSSEPMKIFASSYIGDKVVADAAGCIYTIDYNPSCVFWVMPEPPIGVFGWNCEDSPNLGMFGEQGLYGTWDCIDIH